MRNIVCCSLIISLLLISCCSISNNSTKESLQSISEVGSITDDERFGMFVISNWSTGNLLTDEITELNVNATRSFYYDKNTNYEGIKLALENQQNYGIKQNVTIIYHPNEGIAYLRTQGVISDSVELNVMGFPSDIELYKQFLRDTIDRLEGFGLTYPIDTFQITNEPNWEWFGKITLSEAEAIEQAADPRDALVQWREDNATAVWQSYWEFLRISSIVIKEESPEAKIVLGSGILDKSTTEDIDENVSYFDYIDMHFYGNYLEFKEELDDINSKYSYLNKPFVCYEVGGPMIYNTLFTTENLKEHAGHVIKLHMLGFYNNVSKICYVSLGSIGGYSDYGFYNLGLTLDDYTRKPAYYTYKMMKEKLAGFSDIEQLSDNPYIYKVSFTNKNPLYVLWSKTGEEHVNMGSYFTQDSVTAVSIVTELNSSDDPIYQEQVYSSEDVIITTVPIFIEED